MKADQQARREKLLEEETDSESETEDESVMTHEEAQRLNEDQCFNVETNYANKGLKRLGKNALKDQRCQKEVKSILEKVQNGRYPETCAKGVRLKSNLPEFSDTNFYLNKQGGARVIFKEVENGFEVVAIANARDAQSKSAVRDNLGNEFGLDIKWPK